MDDTDLLRKNVANQLRIVRCTIAVKVLSDLRHAEYCFHYVLKRTAPGPDHWREVFAYPTSDFAMLGSAQPGPPALEGPAHDGLRHKVSALAEGGESSRVVIDFDRPVPVGGTYEFHYRCRTRVESVQSRSVLGSAGAVWYWCAHEFPIDEIAVALTLPRGSKIIATHPQATKPDANPNGAAGNTVAGAVFPRHALAPHEFVVALVTNETRRFGLPIRHARALDVVGGILIGAIGSLLAEWVLTLGR
jgi:hypothetical protein